MSAMNWIDSNKYTLGLLVSILLIAYGLFSIQQEFYTGGWNYLGFGSLGAIIFGALSKRNGKSRMAAGLGVGLGAGMGLFVLAMGVATIIFVGWIFLTFGLG
jgi:hypothetical protein